jgi:metallo-beta-lactamase family protein
MKSRFRPGRRNRRPVRAEGMTRPTGDAPSSVTLQFCGSAHTVTGSCHVLTTPMARILVDCGLFQGPKTLKELNYADFPFRPSDIDAVVLTHAHIDHSGLLPKLVKEGFAGRIFATRGTIDLCSYLLPDAGYIQESEVAALNRRNAARGRAEVFPIYTREDAIASLTAFQPVEYGVWHHVAAGIRARYWNAGHLLGSASIELEVTAGDPSEQPLRILASGDIGPDAKLLQPDPDAPAGFDYVISESTYGDTDRPPVSPPQRRQRLASEVLVAHAAGGVLLIPAFAVERTQELLVELLDLMEKRAIPSAPIFLDSPLAIRATEVFRRHASSLDGDVDIDRLLASPHLHVSETVDESKAIGRLSGFHIIIAASGMCDAGRIRHHLKRWLWRHDATVLLTGFQAQGTLGRFLSEGVQAVRIQGEEIRVAARIRQIDDYSGHADGPELLKWIIERCPIKRGIFLVHGEERALSGLSSRLEKHFGVELRSIVPELDTRYELAGAHARVLDGAFRRRLAPKAVASLDWHNGMSKLILDMSERLDRAPDDQARETIVRTLQRALEEVPSTPQGR